MKLHETMQINFLKTQSQLLLINMEESLITLASITNYSKVVE